MAQTYVPIATTTLGASASTLSFSSIPSTYTDLRVIVNSTLSATAGLRVKYNAIATGYSHIIGYNSGFTWTAATATSQTIGTLSANVIGNTYPFLLIHDIMSYATSNAKQGITRIAADSNTTGSNSLFSVGMLYSSTAAAITSLTFSLSSGSFTTGTTATLYGIKAA